MDIKRILFTFFDVKLSIIVRIAHRVCPLVPAEGKGSQTASSVTVITGKSRAVLSVLYHLFFQPFHRLLCSLHFCPLWTLKDCEFVTLFSRVKIKRKNPRSFSTGKECIIVIIIILQFDEKFFLFWVKKEIMVNQIVEIF